MKTTNFLIGASAVAMLVGHTGMASAQTAMPAAAMTDPSTSTATVAANPTESIAQVTPPAATADDTGNQAASNQSVGDIVVTAQRRSENLQKVPIVVTAVSGAQLQTAGVTTLVTLNTVAPGFNARNTSGAFQPYIRGIGTSSNVVENPVALYIDGVYLPQQREGARELPDVDQVAVLKGPQGTLFGRNATGGVIQITTRRPSQQSELDFTAGIDSYATLRAGAYVTGGLASTLAGSLSVDLASQQKGYGRNVTTGNDTDQLLHSIALRTKLLWTPDAATDITLIADYMDRREHAFTFVPYPGTQLSVPQAPVADKLDTRSNVDPYVAFHGGGVSLAIDRDLGFAKLVAITSYRQGSSNYLFDDAPNGGNSPLYVHVDGGGQPNRDYTGEVQLVSNANQPFSYTFGVFYYYNRLANTPIVRNFSPAFFGGVAPPTANQTTYTYGVETTRSVAPFGQVGIELFKGTKLTLGGRFTNERRELPVGYINATRFTGVQTTTTFNYAPLTINKPSWRIALDHQFGPDVLGYASYNRGIKSGGYNILNPANAPYLPEQLDAYEAGLKTELFDRRLRLNVGGFYYNYTNVQVTQFVGIAQAIVNGAAAELYGADIDFTARVTPRLTLSGGLEALHANFTQYKNAVGSTPKPAGGATVFPVDASGNRLPQSEQFVGQLSTDYEVPISSGSLHYNLTASYNGDYYIEADNFLRQPPFVLLNTSLTWTARSERYSLSLWLKNLADERVIANSSSQAIGYPTSYLAQPPRTVGITARTRFR